MMIGCSTLRTEVYTVLGLKETVTMLEAALTVLQGRRAAHGKCSRERRHPTWS